MRYSLARLITVCVLGLPLLLALNTGVVHAGSKSPVTLCHIPPGNPANRHTITVGENAVHSHLNHGDLLGSCLSNCDILCNDGDAWGKLPRLSPFPSLRTESESVTLP